MTTLRNSAGQIVQPVHFRADLHEAKELARVLELLPVDLRVRWLRLCCLKVSQGALFRIDVTDQGDATARDMLGCFYSICGQNGLTLEWALALAEHLEQRRQLDGIIQDIRSGRV